MKIVVQSIVIINMIIREVDILFCINISNLNKKLKPSAGARQK